VFVLGVVLAIVPARSAALAIAGCAAIWIGLYIFMRESARTIRWFATPMIAIFGWFILISVSGSMAGWAPSGQPATVGTEPVQATTSGASLDADVRLTGAQFLVTNRGHQPWTDVMLSVTGSDHAIYTTRADRVDAGQTAVVQVSRFVASDGHPFRTATTRPQSLTIDARTATNEQRGTYTVRWR
jgi:hypothetical protein